MTTEDTEVTHEVAADNLEEAQKSAARNLAHEKLREAEMAWHIYFCTCEVGQERIMAGQIYEKIRTAACTCQKEAQ